MSTRPPPLIRNNLRSLRHVRVAHCPVPSDCSCVRGGRPRSVCLAKPRLSPPAAYSSRLTCLVLSSGWCYLVWMCELCREYSVLTHMCSTTIRRYNEHPHQTRGLRSIFWAYSICIKTTENSPNAYDVRIVSSGRRNFGVLPASPASSSPFSSDTSQTQRNIHTYIAGYTCIV